MKEFQPKPFYVIYFYSRQKQHSTSFNCNFLCYSFERGFFLSNEIVEAFLYKDKDQAENEFESWTETDCGVVTFERIYPGREYYAGGIAEYNVTCRFNEVVKYDKLPYFTEGEMG